LSPIPFFWCSKTALFTCLIHYLYYTPIVKDLQDITGYWKCYKLFTRIHDIIY
jgi:hypothetical protein